MHTKFKVAGAAVIGRTHESKGIPLQDKVYTFRSKNQKEVVIALADGAGSCKYSQIGAETVTSKIGKIVLDNFESLFKENAPAKSFIYDKLLNKLKEMASSTKVSLKDLASTLLFVVIREKKKETQYIAGHIGDGLIIHFKNGKPSILSYPDNDEYSNFTFFITSRNALEHFRIFKGKLNDGDGFMLLSDGTAESLYKKKEKLLALACNIMFKWCDLYKQNSVSKALRNNLQKVFREKTFDDCSIAMLKRVKK